jgi:hypothetical protein
MKRGGLIIGGVGLVAVVAVAAIFAKPSVIDVSKEYEGKGYFGRRFETKQDLLVVTGSGMKEAQLEKLGGGMPEKNDLTGKLPMDWYGEKIHGLLPSGGRFRIVGARRSTSKTMGNDYFLVELESEGPMKGGRFCTRFIERFQGEQLYDPQYAVEVASVTK